MTTAAMFGQSNPAFQHQGQKGRAGLECGIRLGEWKTFEIHLAALGESRAGGGRGRGRVG